MESRVIACLTILAMLESYAQAAAVHNVADSKTFELQMQPKDWQEDAATEQGIKQAIEQATQAFFSQFEDGDNAYIVLKVLEFLGQHENDLEQPLTNEEEEELNKSVSTLVDSYTELKTKGVFETIKKALLEKETHGGENCMTENEKIAEFIASAKKGIEVMEAKVAKYEACYSKLHAKEAGVKTDEDRMKSEGEISSEFSEGKLENSREAMTTVIKIVKVALIKMRAMVRAAEMLQAADPIATSLKYGAKARAKIGGRRFEFNSISQFGNFRL